MFRFSGLKTSNQTALISEEGGELKTPTQCIPARDGNGDGKRSYPSFNHENLSSDLPCKITVHQTVITPLHFQNKRISIVAGFLTGKLLPPERLGYVAFIILKR
jgi:hypothetical protein